MKKPELQNAIRVNHRGFMANGYKTFVMTENKTNNEEFSVYLIDDVVEKIAYTGKLNAVREGENTYYTGDFSKVTREGDYFIVAGGYRSRQFVIYSEAYDICQRLMLEYFTYQRCGHALGWNGECHLDDGYIYETGEHVDLSGGYHQSCDLRKSPGGVSIGVLGMLRFAMKDRSAWGKIRLPDEVKWACDYYVKTIQENGAMYNTLNAPHGWQGRVFYKSPAPSSAQWNVTSILATGSRFFGKIDPELSKKYLEKALLSYKFMKSEQRPKGVYRHPEKYLMGMDPDFFYDQCEIGSTSDIAYEISVSCDLYKATGNEAYLETVRSLLPQLLENLDGFVLLRNKEKDRTVTSSCSYSWLMGGLLSFCDAYELVGDVCDLKAKIRQALEEIAIYMDKFVFKKARRLYSNSDLEAKCGHSNETFRQAIGELSNYGEYYFAKSESFEPSISCYFGTFIARAARLVGEPKYLLYAQAIADDLMGENELDSSHIRGVGYNNPQSHAYGQFFPSTPFIPGAVGVGYHTIDVYEHSSEYDMPCVGLSMYMLSELKESYNGKME